MLWAKESRRNLEGLVVPGSEVPGGCWRLSTGGPTFEHWRDPTRRSQGIGSGARTHLLIGGEIALEGEGFCGFRRLTAEGCGSQPAGGGRR